MTLQTTRRDFLRGAGAVGAALIVGVDPNGALATPGTTPSLNPFVRIAADGSVSAVIKHFEMGQGTTTGLTTLIAEELDADWETTGFEFAPSDNATYQNLLFGLQGTGGSTAIANSFLQYRAAAAAARAMLVEAAAAEWGVAPGDVSVENGVLSAGETSAHFGAFVEAAAALTPPAEPALKSRSEFRLIGRDGLPRKDSPAKTDGTATFAIDVRVEGMVYAMLLRAPRFGGKLVSFDAGAAAEVPGFIEAKAIPAANAVAVIASSTWAAKSARDEVLAEWDFSEAENRGTDELIAYHKSLLDAPEFEARAGADRAATEAALDGDAVATIIEADYLLPYLAHAPMEPLNCVLEPRGDGGVILHDGCQFPGITHSVLSTILGLPMEKVEIRTVFAGGAFGRRATPDADYQAEAALVFDALGRQTPVKLIWTREDDVRGGYYRPMAAHRARIGLDAEGRIVAWDHRIAVKSILVGTPFEAFLVHDGVDETSVEGLANTPYAIDGLSVGLSNAQTPISALWWRAVGHTHTAYVIETLIDRVAEAAGMDPIAYRLTRLLSDETNPDHQRLAGVLRLAAERAGWDAPAAEGRYRGVAAHKSFNSYVAQIFEVSLDGDAVSLEQVDCAVDCGVAVNPDVIRAQMEGGIGYGVGAVMRNEVTLTEGEVDQENFPDYEPLRISDMPRVRVHIVPSEADPTGVGEPGTPPAGPALANAVFAATGARITTLPMASNGVDFV